MNDNRDKLINELAIDFMRLKIENMQLKYEIDDLRSLAQELELKKLEIAKLQEKVGKANEN